MPVNNNTTNSLENMASAGQASSTTAMNQVASDVASGNTQAASNAMNQFALGQLQVQEASAMEGEIQDTIKAEIQNLNKA